LKNTIYIFLLVLVFISCKNEKNLNVVETTTEQEETIYWIDTLANHKYLKIYSTPEKKWRDLFAEYGNNGFKHKIDIREIYYLNVPISNEVAWITDKSIALVDGCGTDCIYVLIFNVEQNNPFVHPIYYYPNMSYLDYETDNPNLYIAVNERSKKDYGLVIIDTDTQKKDTIYLPKNWARGLGSIYNIVDKVAIKNSIITFTQIEENKQGKTYKHTIKLR